MKYLRRLVWYLSSRLLILFCVLGLMTMAFYFSMNATNIYIILKDGMAKRAQVVMMGEDENLNAYFSSAYLERDVGNKQAFLDGFAQAEELLDSDFSDYAADPDSVDALRSLDVPFLKQHRRENAFAIYEALNELDNPSIRPLFPQMGADDTPLFVPVLVDPAIRADLRRFLIQNQVYCPIHWPDAQTGGGAVLYASELSLLCDQRYTTEDVKKEMNLIKEFLIHHA